MIRWSRPEDAKQVVPLIDIVFEEMEIPALMALPKADLYPVFEQAFLLEDYRYGWPRTLVHEGSNGVDGILVGYHHDQEDAIDAAFAPLLPKIGLAEDAELFPDVETDPEEWYIDTLAVAENAQRQGIGSALLRGIEPLVKQQGATLMSLNVDVENPQAEVLYKRHGYTYARDLMIGAHRYRHMIKPL